MSDLRCACPIPEHITTTSPCDLKATEEDGLCDMCRLVAPVIGSFGNGITVHHRHHGADHVVEGFAWADVTTP